ncbi:TPA: hypothetical protein HA318_00370 [Candidatus Micrarchaeota archaeon]|nr:hypothetical protein [Candidatus Micrarchaeota archaeon]
MTDRKVELANRIIRETVESASLEGLRKTKSFAVLRPRLASNPRKRCEPAFFSSLTQGSEYRQFVLMLKPPENAGDFGSSYAGYRTWYFPKGTAYSIRGVAHLPNSAFAKVLIEQKGKKLKLLLYPIQKTLFIDDNVHNVGGNREVTARQRRELLNRWVGKHAGKIGVATLTKVWEFLELEGSYYGVYGVNPRAANVILQEKAAGILRTIQDGRISNKLLIPKEEVIRSRLRTEKTCKKDLRLAALLHDHAQEVLCRRIRALRVTDAAHALQGVERHFLFVPLAEQIAERLRKEGFEVELHAMHPDNIVPELFEVKPARETIALVKLPLQRLAESFPASSFALKFMNNSKTRIKTVRVS